MTRQDRQPQECKCVREGKYDEYQDGMCFYCWNEKERNKRIEEVKKQRKKEGTDQSTVLY